MLRVSCKVNVKPEEARSIHDSGFTLTLQEARSIQDSMNIPKIEFITCIYI